MGFGTFGFNGFGRRGFDLPSGSEVAVGPEGRARLRYDEVAKELQVSLNGGVFQALDVGGSGSSSDIVITDDTVDAFQVREGANQYISIDTTDGSEQLALDAPGGEIEIGSVDTNDVLIGSLGASVSIQIGRTTGDLVAFFGGSPITRPTVTGDKGGNAALASLVTELANLGLIGDGTS